MFGQRDKNVDPDKIHRNLYSGNDKTVDEAMNRHYKASGGKRQKQRKNTTFANEFVISGSPEMMAKLTRSQLIKYFNESARWLIELHGGDNMHRPKLK